MSPRSLSLVIIAVICLAPMIAAADSHREETTPTGWWWYTNVTEAQINTIISANGARLVDIEVFSADPLRFTAAFVHNSGVYYEPTWWHPAADGAVIDSMLAANDARLIDIEWYDTDAGPLLAVVMIDNTGRDAKAWWWSVGTNGEALADAVDDNEARLVDLESFDDGGLKYAAIMVDNTGADATDWWYFLGASAATLGASMAANDSRLLEFDVHDPVADTYDAILIPSDGAEAINWWWYYDITPDQINFHLSQNGARIADIDTYVEGPLQKYSVLMVNNSNELTTKMGNLFDYGADGSTGAYLKEVGGPVLASLQPTFVFEPSSSLKVTHHLYAMRRVMLGEDHLHNNFTVAEGITGRSCPNDGAPFNDQSLQETLGGMMWNSDNTDTRAIELRYGRSAINDTSRNLVGMVNTSINRRMGCAEFPLNESTLEEFGMLYEGVAQGLYLDTYHRDVFYLLMQSENTSDPWWFTRQMEDLIHEVATDLGVPGVAADYWNDTRLAWKPGGDNMFIDSNLKVFRSVAGWVSLPWGCTGPRSLRKDFVFGTFVHMADDTTYADNRLFRETIEIFREQVTAGLIACVSAADDAPAARHVLGQNVPNPFNPLTTIAFALPDEQVVSLKIYDVAGRLVRVLLDEEPAPAGRNEIVWNGRGAHGRPAPAGVYFYRLDAEGFSETKRMVLVK